MGVHYLDIIEKMRWAGKLKNDSAVARVLEVTPQALSNYKKRGEMPTDLVLRFAKLFGLSLDWLIYGEGAMYRPGVEATERGIRDYLSTPESAPSNEETSVAISVFAPVVDYLVAEFTKKLEERGRDNGVELHP